MVTHSQLAADELLHSLQAVLDKITEVNGGTKAIEEARSLRLWGEISSGEHVYEFVMLKKRPHFVRMTFFHQGRVVDNAFDGQRVWRETRMDDRRRVEVASDDESARMLFDTDFDGPLIGEPLPGVQRRLIGDERIDRVVYYLIGVDRGDARSVHYIDSRTFREWKSVTTRVVDGETRRLETVFDDYRRVGTIWVAHAITRKVKDGQTEQVRILNAELNPGILDRAFMMPEIP
jgi:hypothetical protein